MKTSLKNQVRLHRRAFTLVELLVVISIIAVLAALTLAVLPGVTKQKKIGVAKAEMALIQAALENYHAKYSVYPPSNPSNPLVNQLYYELTGVTNTAGTAGVNYQTLDGNYQISGSGYSQTFGGVGGVINCSRGNGEDAVSAKNFLPGLKPTEWTTGTNSFSGGNQIPYLVTSAGGPDDKYHPTYSFSGNPFRYVCPGTNNPNGYDLWVQLSIGSTFDGSGNPITPKYYLVCNWNSAAQLNRPLP